MFRRCWTPALFRLLQSSPRFLRVRDPGPRAQRPPRLTLEDLEGRTLLSPVVSVLAIHPQEGQSFTGPVARRWVKGKVAGSVDGSQDGSSPNGTG